VDIRSDLYSLGVTLRVILIECYRMMWRHKFANARAGFMQLPPETHFAPRLQITI
jgi:hypothetical protein